MRRGDGVLTAVLAVALLASLAIVARGWWRAWPDTIDDAHITFRYVENLLAGRGLSFNPGQIVEGYSNPLFLLLLVPWVALGIPAEHGAQASWCNRPTSRRMSFAFMVKSLPGLAKLVRWRVPRFRL